MTEQEAKQLEVNIEWNGRANVCVHCGRVPERFYIVTGHDHTDDSIAWCPCRGVSEIEKLRTTSAEQAERIKQLEGYKTKSDNYCALLMDANQRIAQLEDALRVAMECVESYSANKRYGLVASAAKHKINEVLGSE